MTIVSKNQVNIYCVSEADDNQRLDNLLIKLLKIPKSHIYKIVRSGEVKVNKNKVPPQHKVFIGDKVRIPPIREGSNDAKPAACNKPQVVLNHDCAKTFNNGYTKEVIFEDEYFLVMNKPAKTACHGGSGISFGIIEQLRFLYQKNYSFLELAHRLDKDTSGLLVLAKKRQALVKLQQALKQGNIYKEYTALVIGKWHHGNNYQLTLPLAKKVGSNQERYVVVDNANGQFARTEFSLIKQYTSHALVKAVLKTGRTHQIRVHLQALMHPIAGDVKYGDFSHNKQLASLSAHPLRRMFLHANKMVFIHPMTEEKLTLLSPLPSELALFLATLKPIRMHNGLEGIAAGRCPSQ